VSVEKRQLPSHGYFLVHGSWQTDSQMSEQTGVQRKKRKKNFAQALLEAYNPFGTLSRVGLNPIKLAHNPSRPDGRLN